MFQRVQIEINIEKEGNLGLPFNLGRPSTKLATPFPEVHSGQPIL